MELLVRFVADGLLIVILAIAGGSGLFYAVKNHKVAAFAPYAVMAALSSLYVAKLMSLIYQPSLERPYLQQGLEAGAAYIDNPGFPSDHMLLGAVVIIMLYVLTPYKKLVIVLFGAVIVMGIGRVLALVHTPLDVVAGFALAWIGAIWYIPYRHHDSNLS